jgi:tRNA(Ser,Leu) C12 N-acetylase TAN1
MKQAGQEFNKIIDGKFDNPNIQKAYNVLSDSQKNDLKKEAIRKYNEFQTIFSVRADESRRVQADGSKKAVDNVVKKANADLYDPNLIKESFKGNEKLINDFSQINILSNKNELSDSSAYPVKYEILKNISLY